MRTQHEDQRQEHLQPLHKTGIRQHSVQFKATTLLILTEEFLADRGSCMH